MLCIGVVLGKPEMYAQSPLPYDFSALEPSIDEQTMRLHHGTHAAGYFRRMSATLDGLTGDAADMSLEELFGALASMELPEAAAKSLRNDGGGHWNHELFWKVMSPTGSQKDMSPALKARILKAFGSVEGLKKEFLDAAKGVFGSGWAWLCVDPATGGLLVTSTPNQDNPLMEGLVSTVCEPILGVDVWEHGYYLKYQAGRGDYLEAFWGIINWQQVSENFLTAFSR